MSKISYTSINPPYHNLSLKDLINKFQNIFLDEYLVLQVCKHKELNKFLLIEKMIDSAKINFCLGNEIEAFRLCVRAICVLKIIEKNTSIKFFYSKV